jgi:hypothetical protein
MNMRAVRPTDGQTRRGREERGLAMVMTVIIIMVAALLAAVILVQGSSSDRHSGRGKNWNQALQSADAGVQNAVAKLQATNGAAPAPFQGSSVEGRYSVTVTYLGRNRYQVDSVGQAGNAQSLKSQRHVRVIMAPPKTFKYALFSDSDIDTKNNDLVNGDIWANGNVTVDQGDTVNGSVNSATGYVFMRSNSRITGDVQTGAYSSSGYAVDGTANGTSIGGNIRASTTNPDENCAGEPLGKYKVAAGSIDGKVTTLGTQVSGADPAKTFTNVCTHAPATKPMPTFNWEPSNYDPPPVEFASPSAFKTYVNANKASMQGTFVINGGGQNDPVDITGIQVSGDLTIVAWNAPITADNGSADVTAANNNEKLVVLVSYYSPPAGAGACASNGGNPGDCAIGIKNNFQVSDNTATLVYAPNGPVAFKNNAEFFGAVYASNIVMKNNQVTTYDPAVEQVIGFGPVTLSQESWQEING